MMRATDHTGKVFHRLTAIEQVESHARDRRRGAVWLCRCVCGNELRVQAIRLVTEQKKSCGCGQHKLTPAKRQELLTSYLAHGYAATVPLAKSYGIAPRYLARLARRAGHVNNYQRNSKPKRPPKRPFVDVRWKWAAKRGAVLA